MLSTVVSYLWFNSSIADALLVGSRVNDLSTKLIKSGTLSISLSTRGIYSTSVYNDWYLNASIGTSLGTDSEVCNCHAPRHTCPYVCGLKL